MHAKATAIALAATLSLALPDREGVAGPTWSIENALKGSGLAYSRTETGAHIVIFAATEPEVETWPITVCSAAGGDWVLVFATLLHADEGKFDAKVLREALAHNSRAAGSKLALDTAAGDLDVQYEIPAVALTPEVLRLIVNDVAATCDAQYRVFRDLTE